MNIKNNRWIEYDPPEWNTPDIQSEHDWRITKWIIAIAILFIVL